MKIRAHETFNFRRGWLRKGVKNILLMPDLFTSKDINPCGKLGIGTNMVRSLRYWLIATGVCEEPTSGKHVQKLTSLGELIDKYDKYFEEDGTLWLIQYRLATNKENATAWYWFYNEFDVQGFNKELFVGELAEYLNKESYQCSSKMLEDEFSCIIKTYYAKDEDNPEETNTCPLVSLKLIINPDKGEYRKNTPNRESVPALIVLATIVAEHPNQLEINISELIDKCNSVGKVFNLDKSTLFYLLEELAQMGYIQISRTAGLDVIRLNEKYTFEEIVEKYYLSLSGN